MANEKMYSSNILLCIICGAFNHLFEKVGIAIFVHIQNLVECFTCWLTFTNFDQKVEVYFINCSNGTNPAISLKLLWMNI